MRPLSPAGSGIFTPARDQDTVSRLRVTVKQITKINQTFCLSLVSGDLGFSCFLDAMPSPAFAAGDALLIEHAKGSNPFTSPALAIYHAERRNPMNIIPFDSKEKRQADLFDPELATMTSFDISELLGKRHDNVKRTIKRLAGTGLIDLPPTAEVVNKQALSPNNKQLSYLFSGKKGRRDSIVVVARMSPEFTSRLVDRWQELEEMAAARMMAAVPDNYSEALRLAADLADENTKLKHERNEAIRTKAHISKGREASAMGKASAAARKLARLEDELGRSARQATVRAIESVTKTRIGQGWRKLRAWCVSNDVKPENVKDDLYGSVKAYPAGAWKAVFNIDLAKVFGSEK